MRTLSAIRTSRLAAGGIVAVGALATAALAWRHRTELAQDLGTLIVLAAAAALTAVFAASGTSRRPIRLSAAFMLAALIGLPAPSALVVCLFALAVSRGGGAAGPWPPGIVSAAANVAAWLAVQGVASLVTISASLAAPLTLLELVGAFLIAQGVAAAVWLMLARLGGIPVPPAGLGTVLLEAVNIALAWLLLVLLDLGSPLAVGAMTAVLVLGGYGLRLLDRAFLELHATNAVLASRVSELATLHAIGREIVSSLDPERVCRIVERECRKIFEADLFVLATVDHDTKQLRVLHRSARSEPVAESILPIGEGLLSWVVENKRGVLVGDVAEEGDSLPFRPKIIDSTIRSAIATPLVVAERVAGVLSVQSRASRAYDTHQLSVLTTIAQQAAVALENARHHTLATTDSLTGLTLREYFFRRLDEEYKRSQRYEGSFVVMMLDLDGFKVVNDRHGHLAGDRYLRTLGSLIRARLRGADLACRYGGDEFCLMLPETDLTGARPIADRLRAAIGDLVVDVGGATARCTVSVGLAAFPDHDAGDLRALVLRADQALYQAKRSGRDKVVTFEDSPAGLSR